MVCVGLLTTIRISGTAAFRGWVVVDAALGFGVAGLELVGAPCDSDWVSALGVTVLGVWDSEPVVPVLGVWDSDPVWALAAKASIAPRAATLSKRQCLRKADRRI
jgi:hypothetical protein